MKIAKPIVIVLCLMSSAAMADPLGTAFTYQGQLKSGGSPASGSYDLQFSLWDASIGGNQLGSTQCSDNVTVANGLFTDTLDFGAQFNGSARWLEIGVRADSTPGNCATGSYSTLSPRQALTAAPYSNFSAAPWTTNGSNINYPAGSVGIGTTSPAAPLHVSPAGGICMGVNPYNGGYTALQMSLSSVSGGNAQLQTNRAWRG